MGKREELGEENGYDFRTKAKAVRFLKSTGARFVENDGEPDNGDNWVHPTWRKLGRVGF